MEQRKVTAEHRKMVDELYEKDSLSAWEFNFIQNLARDPDVSRHGLTFREQLMVEKIYGKRIKKRKPSQCS